MKIDAHTKISALIKHHPGAIDTLVAISPKFNKLRNPVLRKLLATRATISMAAGIAGYSLDEFFKKLEPLGFERSTSPTREDQFVSTHSPLNYSQVSELDVRGILRHDRDPLPQIMKKIRGLKKGEALRIINSFEPKPLMELLQKQGYDSHTGVIGADIFHTYFYHRDGATPAEPSQSKNVESGWDEKMDLYRDRIEEIDVRELEMPGPMIRILEELEKMDGGKALFVHHKRVPQLLLPELDARNFSYVYKTVSDHEVNLLIYPKEELHGAN
jgi:uncharacterized protein (DUF2249 family)